MRGLPELLKDRTFGFDVRGEIAVGRRDAGMAEIIANQSHIDSCLKKGNGAAMSKAMGCNPTFGEGWYPPGSASRVFLKDICGTVSPKWAAPSAAEDGLGRVWRQDTPEGAHGFRPKWAESFLASLPDDSNLIRAREVQVGAANGQSLAHPSAGIVEEEQQSIVT